MPLDALRKIVGQETQRVEAERRRGPREGESVENEDHDAANDGPQHDRRQAEVQGAG